MVGSGRRREGKGEEGKKVVLGRGGRMGVCAWCGIGPQSVSVVSSVCLEAKQ